METCSHCGQPRSVCGDPERTWYPQRVICFAERERLAAQQAFDRLHHEMPYHDGTYQRWAKDQTSEFPFKYDDGSHIYTASADADPDDDFLTNKNAVPTAPETGEG
jgi:hypothetical protein